ncbi:MAG: prepilin-type N-terminal cleavage/methylation domain-containing protein [Sedimentisphaerales bacterium]|nr:prepilin-type N-terminal cleavage/methylation domain-containing protein [Sedimentisphaerales bacterium]MBN2842037.1 prepilin-type N-terminal cleavage/methylation domain-containing protein [Sedimentisphaerales bacterium]
MKYRNKAFTLIELLVVITIIALLVSILMPSLNKAKQQATATVCLGNQKALITAWLMYAGDNGDRIIGGMRSTYLSTGGDVAYRGGDWEAAGKCAWACAPAVPQMNDKNASNADLSTEQSLTYRKRGVELGKMWKYVKTHEVYHCPGDKSEKFAKPLDSFVTYAISSSMNGEDAIPTAVVKAYKSTGQIKNSVERMVFLEENKQEQSYLRGSFALDIRAPFLTNSTWKDYPANWHNKKGTLAFADGHAEITPWESPMTLQLAMDTKRNFNFSPNDKFSLNNPDLEKFIRWYGAIR